MPEETFRAENHTSNSLELNILADHFGGVVEGGDFTRGEGEINDPLDPISSQDTG